MAKANAARSTDFAAFDHRIAVVEFPDASQDGSAWTLLRGLTMIRAILLAGLMLAAVAARAETPSDAVRFFYKSPMQSMLDPAFRGRFIDPARGLLDLNDKSQQNEEGICIEFDPSTDAQDFDEGEIGKTLNLSELEIGDDAEVTVRFKLFPNGSPDEVDRQMVWSLKRQGDGWKIADVESVTGKWKLSDIKCEPEG